MEMHAAAKGFELTADLEKYAAGKLNRIARRVPREFRKTADCKLALTRRMRGGAKIHTCSITLTFDGVELKASETTQHAHAALDVAAAHIDQQLKMCKRERRGGLLRRRARSG